MSKEDLNKERNKLLHHLQGLLEGPMVVLGFIWLVLLVIDLVKGLNPFLQTLSTLIWIIFILDFGLKFILAPAKISFLKSNVLTAISLLVLALRIFRVARAFRLIRSLRAVRGLRLVKVVGSLNRGLNSLSASMRRRGFGYVLTSTLLVALLGSVGMYVFENAVESGFKSYGEALWWTVMLYRLWEANIGRKHSKAEYCVFCSRCTDWRCSATLQLLSPPILWAGMRKVKKLK